jgi:hypothetical protein
LGDFATKHFVTLFQNLNYVGNFAISASLALASILYLIAVVDEPIVAKEVDHGKVTEVKSCHAYAVEWLKAVLLKVASQGFDRFFLTWFPAASHLISRPISSNLSKTQTRPFRRHG